MLLVAALQTTANVKDVWPLGGPARGGTRVWVLADRAHREATSLQLSIHAPGSHPVNQVSRFVRPLFWAKNVSRHSAILFSAIMPALPTAIHSPIRVQLWLGRHSVVQVKQLHGSSARMFNFFAYLPDNILHSVTRATECLLDCKLYPPLLFDVAAGLLPASGVVPAHSIGRPAVRAIPPGSTCTSWSLLRPLTRAQCESFGRRSLWLGVQNDPHHSSGCMQRAGSGLPSFWFNAAPATAVTNGCDVHMRGGHCLCLGVLPRLSAARGVMKVASLMQEPAGDGMKGRWCTSMRRLSARWLPMRGFHEFEMPSSEARTNQERWAPSNMVILDSSEITFGAPDAQAHTAIQRRQSIDLVVAMHSAPVSAMLRAVVAALPMDRVSVHIFIYRKGSKIPGAERAAIKRAVGLAGSHAHLSGSVSALSIIDDLSNTGRCDHTYLYHIVQRWKSLADVTVFIKDTTMAHVHLGSGSRLLSFARRQPSPSLHFWCARPMWGTACWYEVSRYRSEACKTPLEAQARGEEYMSTRCYDSDARFIRASIRPVGNWLAHHRIGRAEQTWQNCSASFHEHRPEIPFCPGGIFAASRSAILTSPRTTYERLLAALSIADNMEEGHYVERAWLSLFGGRSSRPLRSSLAVYTIVEASLLSSHTINYGTLAPSQAPCNRTAISKRSRTAIWCMCFSDSRKVLDIAKSRGWRVGFIKGDAAAIKLSALRLKHAPHLSHQLRPFDFTLFVDSQITANVPAALEGMSRYLVDTGASVFLDVMPPASHMHSDTNATSLEPRTVLRRMTAEAAAFGDAWLGEALASGHSASITVLSKKLRDRHKQTVVLFRPSRGTRLLIPLNTTPEHLGQWWEWWTCRSTCCRPQMLP